MFQHLRFRITDSNRHVFIVNLRNVNSEAEADAHELSVVHYRLYKKRNDQCIDINNLLYLKLTLVIH